MKLIFVIVLSLLPGLCSAADPEPLLGSIDGKYYVSPNGGMRIEIPFTKDDASDSSIKDVIFSEALNIIFEDKTDDIRYRIDLSHPESSNTEIAINNRLKQYEGLMNRGYSGTTLLIHFDNDENNSKRYLYKQASPGIVRFHYVQVTPYKKRLLLLWSDFKQANDTPDNEDRIIEGQHQAIARSRKMLSSIKEQE